MPGRREAAGIPLAETSGEVADASQREEGGTGRARTRTQQLERVLQREEELGEAAWAGAAGCGDGATEAGVEEWQAEETLREWEEEWEDADQRAAFEQDEEAENELAQWQAATQARAAYIVMAALPPGTEGEPTQSERWRAAAARRKVEAWKTKLTRIQDAHTDAERMRGDEMQARKGRVAELRQAAQRERAGAEARYMQAALGTADLGKLTARARALTQAAEAAARRQHETEVQHELERTAETAAQDTAGWQVKEAEAAAAATVRGHVGAGAVTEAEAAAEAAVAARAAAEDERMRQAGEEAARAAEAAQTAAAARAEAQARAQAAREQEGKTRTAAREAMAGRAKAARAARAAARQREQEGEQAGVEYWEDADGATRQAIESSPVLRLFCRRKWIEQAKPVGRSVDGVPIGMEPRERSRIDTERTKQALAAALAIEKQYDIDTAYAVDGSADTAPALAEDETGAAAAAWGAWDGQQARGGALPPGLGNQTAELVAIERMLARHEAGDRVLLLCDCQAAMQAVEAAWRCGELGRQGAMNGRLGGGIIEAITRHRIRMAGPRAGGPTGTARTGCACLLWVKAHGGGVAPNAYADAIAKSHLGEEPGDVPLAEQLPRVCVYAVAGVGAGVGRRRWEVAADQPLRTLIVERLTRKAQQDMRAGSATTRTEAERAGPTDKRVMAAVMDTEDRPQGARAGRAGGGEDAAGGALSATGRALRLRTDDMQIGHGGRCVLCGATSGLDGGHVLRCPRLREHAAGAAQRAAAGLRRAALSTTTRAQEAPQSMRAEEWRAGVAGEQGAAEAMRALERGARGSATLTATAPEGVEAWATAGWRKTGDEYSIAGDSALEADARRVQWCAMYIGQAYTEACERAKAAAVAAGGEAGEGAQEAATSELGKAAKAILAAAQGGRGCWAPVEQVTLRYEQMQAARTSIGEQVDVRTTADEWLQAAHGARPALDGEWRVYTRRGFREGSGAAQRKEVETKAVAPDGTVYDVAQPNEWPWRVEYYVTVRVADGDEAQVRMRLGKDDAGGVAVRVWGSRPRHGGSSGGAAVSPEAADDVEGARVLFWVHTWGTGGGGDTGRRRELMLAAEAAEQGGTDWERLRRAMGGEVRVATAAERAEERRGREERRARTVAAQAALREAEAAARRADRAARGTATTGTGPEAGEGRGEGADAMAVLAEAAGQLGADLSTGWGGVRRQYLREALRHHPDKGGQMARFQATQQAYETLNAATPEERGQATAAAVRAKAAGAEPECDAAQPTPAEAAAQRATAHTQVVEAQEELEEAQAAEAGARMAWERIAEGVRAAAAAYFQAWGAYQRRVLQTRAGWARAAGHATLRAQMAAEAATRVVQARERRARDEEVKVQAMRAREMRVMERRTAARRESAQQLRGLAGRQLLAALSADYATVAGRARVHVPTVTRDCRVQVPWAMWCLHECICERAHCRHRGSTRYEQYVITSATGTAEEDAPSRQQMEITLERSAAKKPIPYGGSSTWDRFTVHWEHVAGIRRYGPEQLGMMVEMSGQAGGSSASETGAEEEERQHEDAERRRARREAVALLRDMVATSAAAEAEARAHAECGAEAAEPDGGTTAAETAYQAEDAGTADGDSAEDADEARRDGDATTDAEDGNERESGEEACAATSAGGEPRRRRRTPLGVRWWKEMWMGQVALAEFQDAGGTRRRRDVSARTQAAQQMALRANAIGAAALGRAAARGLGRTAMQASLLIHGRGGDAEDARRNQADVARTVTALKAKRGAATLPAAGTLRDAVAQQAARRMSREKPAADAAREAERGQLAREVLHAMDAADDETMHNPGSEESEEEAITRRLARWIELDGGGDALYSAVAAITRVRREGVTVNLREHRQEESEADAEGAERGAPPGAQEHEDGTGQREAGGRQPAMGHVDIGKLAAGHRRPTIPPAPGVEDVEADRRTVLGNVFPIPRTERHSAEWRRHVVGAMGLLLQQLEEGGGCDVERLRWEGPGGRGWWVRKRRVKLEVDREVLAADPTGDLRWGRVRELGAMVAAGTNIRLLCHCRWTRREEAGCLGCHCEPTAAHIEQQARRTNEAKRAGAAVAERDEGREGAEQRESAGQAGAGTEERDAGGPETGPATRRRSWQEMSGGRRVDDAQQRAARWPETRAEPTAGTTATTAAAAAQEGEEVEGGDGRRQVHRGPTGSRETPSTMEGYHDIDTLRGQADRDRRATAATTKRTADATTDATTTTTADARDSAGPEEDEEQTTERETRPGQASATKARGGRLSANARKRKKKRERDTEETEEGGGHE